ncbi:MAG TPA: hypothetical protein DCZ63_15100 [Geobacter sp.]|nr:hypothetical protein [Geobacter sp.]
MKNVIKARIIAAAAAIGSTSTTVKGSHKFILTRQSHPFRSVLTRDIRSRAKYLEKRTMSREARRKSAIPFGADSAAEIREEQRRCFPQRKNWTSPEPSMADRDDSWTAEYSLGRYSTRCTYTKWEYTAKATCWAIDRGKLGLEFHWKDTVSFLQAPAGYKWQKDRNGIRLVSLTNDDKDYHPDSDNLRNYSKKAIAQTINRLYTARKQAERDMARVARRAKNQDRDNLKAIRKAEREGAMICVKDSTTAGNCQAGTIAFANRHNLNPTKHYRPTELLAIANGDAHRVRLAVAVGLRRHYREIRAGFCELADHVA